MAALAPAPGTATLFALRTWRTSPLIRLAERKRLMPNACCGRLIPHRMPQYVRSRRTLHFSFVLSPLSCIPQTTFMKQTARCETPKCARDVPFSLCHSLCLLLSRLLISYVLCSQESPMQCVCVMRPTCRRCCNEIRKAQ